MTWNFAIGCAVGGAAAVLVWGIARSWKYCAVLWKVVASIQPRRRGIHSGVPKEVPEEARPIDQKTPRTQEAAGNEDRLGGHG